MRLNRKCICVFCLAVAAAGLASCRGEGPVGKTVECYSVVFISGGTRVIAVGADKGCIADPKTGSVLQTFDIDWGPRRFIVPGPGQNDFFMLAGSGRAELRRIVSDTETKTIAAVAGKVVRGIHEYGALDFHRDSGLLVVGGEKSTIAYRYADEKLVADKVISAASLFSRFSERGDRLALLVEPGKIQLWNTKSWQIIYDNLLDDAVGLSSLALSADDRWLAAGDSRGQLFLVDLRTGKTARTWQAHGPKVDVEWVEFDRNGDWVLTAGEDFVVHRWDYRDGTRIAKYGPFDGPVNSLNVSSDGKQLAVAINDFKNRANPRPVRVVSIEDGSDISVVKGW